MENRTGYVVLTASEYKDLILEANEYKKSVDTNVSGTKQENIFEKIVLDNLYENNSYHLENIKELNNDDYHYNELVMKFIKLGITDFNYIHYKISLMKDKCENKKEGMEEDE